MAMAKSREGKRIRGSSRWTTCWTRVVRHPCLVVGSSHAQAVVETMEDDILDSP
jgi:hypothetical protein